MTDIQTTEVGLDELLEAGVHFGHQTRRWNPKMRSFIFTERNGIHIIDLRKTLNRLERAQSAVRQSVSGGERVLFVCTKRQLRGIIRQEAERCGSFHVTERWLGGMLTNFQTIKKQIRRLRELERGQEENAFEFYTKKERLLLDRERAKLDKYLSGVKEMGRLPGALFVVDAKREIIAVREAHRLGIPVIAIADTNADPDLIDYPIPGNDDAIRSVSLIAKAISDAILQARRAMPEEERKRAAEAEATTYSTETGEKEVQDRAAVRRPRRRRRPRPEVIAQHRRSDEEEATSSKDVEATAEATPDAPASPEGDADDAAAAEASNASGGADSPEAAAAPETGGTTVETSGEAPEAAAAGEGESSAEGAEQKKD